MTTSIFRLGAYLPKTSFVTGILGGGVDPKYIVWKQLVEESPTLGWDGCCESFRFLLYRSPGASHRSYVFQRGWNHQLGNIEPKHQQKAIYTGLWFQIFGCSPLYTWRNDPSWWSYFSKFKPPRQTFGMYCTPKLGYVEHFLKIKIQMLSSFLIHLSYYICIYFLYLYIFSYILLFTFTMQIVFWFFKLPSPPKFRSILSAEKTFPTQFWPPSFHVDRWAMIQTPD